MAELKIKSPSVRVLGRMEDIEKISREYKQGGADLISLVIDKKKFGGDLKMIQRVKRNVDLPIFAKDFIKSENRLEEIKNAGASAVLLLAFLVAKEKLKLLYKKALRMGLFPVVEIDNEKDLDMAIEEKFPVIAVNARNLRDLSVDKNKAISLIKKIPENIISLAFSGVRNKDDVRNYLNAGAKGVLIGTSLMRAENKIAFLRKIRPIS